MNIERQTIISQNVYNGTSPRTAPFTYIKYTFDYRIDKQLIDQLYCDAENLARHVRSEAANNSNAERKEIDIFANCFGGVVSEYCWKDVLNRNKLTVTSTEYTDPAVQIDLEVVSNHKTIEVRSSSVRNGITFAIFNSRPFDIIGPYVNSYKHNETAKDYYIRALFHFANPLDIISVCKSNEFNVYLVGGVTKQMMFDDRISEIKSMIKKRAYDIEEETSTKYRTVPYTFALDTIQMIDLITNEK